MGRTSAIPGPNMIDGGSASKPMLNDQPERNALYQGQNVAQNIGTAGTQANVNAVRTLQTGGLEISDADYKAQEFARDYIASALYANDAGSAMMKLNAITQSPDKAQFLNDLAVSKAMAIGTSPDLAAAAAQGAQYA